MGQSSSRFGLQDGGQFPDYLRRLCDFHQMDFESAFEQLFSLLSAEPQKVYVPTSSGLACSFILSVLLYLSLTPFFVPLVTLLFIIGNTKNQWARDDPAFIVVQLLFVEVAALAYAMAFQNASIWGYLWALLYALVVDWFLVGVVVASTCCYLANKYLRQYHSHSVEQEVEWMYAFDVHTNGYICGFVLTHILQYFLLPFLLNTTVLSCLASNLLYSIALLWYAYITHLGYRALPFLGNTQVFLWYPIIGLCFGLVLSVVLMILGLRINLTRIVMAFHYG